MRRVLTPFVLAGLLLFGAAAKIDKLESYERDHFEALKVFMDKKQQKTFFKGKTPAERDQYLKDIKMWDRFYQYEEDQRKAVVSRQVERGFTRDMVLMAWGPPVRKSRLAGRAATRSEGLTYRFEVTSDGAHLVWEPDSKTTYKAVDRYTIEVIVDDNYVVEMHERKGWD